LKKERNNYLKRFNENLYNVALDELNYAIGLDSDEF